MDLTALDRCDRCGAPASLVVEMTAGPLMFCRHHAREYGFTDLPTLAAHTPPRAHSLRSE